MEARGEEQVSDHARAELSLECSQHASRSPGRQTAPPQVIANRTPSHLHLPLHKTILIPPFATHLYKKVTATPASPPSSSTFPPQEKARYKTLIQQAAASAVTTHYGEPRTGTIPSFSYPIGLHLLNAKAKGHLPVATVLYCQFVRFLVTITDICVCGTFLPTPLGLTGARGTDKLLSLSLSDYKVLLRNKSVQKQHSHLRSNVYIVKPLCTSLIH